MIGAAFFLALVVAAGLLGPAGCALAVTGLPPPPPKACSTDAECDDTNPCTDDVCASKQCEHPLSAYVPNDNNECTVDSCSTGEPANDGKPALGKKCGGSGTLACDGMGNCKGCATDADCQPSTGCQSWVCNTATKICDPTNAPVSMPTTDKTPDDCMGTFCDGKGGTVETPLPMNTTCNVNGGRFCDGGGLCYACVLDANCTMGLKPSCDLPTHTCVSCDDNTQNGNETGKDCGGSKCGGCQGAPCGGGCSGTLSCVDGVCCNEACAGVCRACNMQGNCTNVPTGLADPGTCNGPALLCDGFGACKSGFGQPCAAPAQCYSGACRAGFCRRAQGDSCTDSEECGTNRCIGGTCQPCAGDPDCPGSTCVAATCTGKPGAPCINATDCSGQLQCTNGLCHNPQGGPCGVFFQCSTGICSGNMCKICNQNSDCATVKPVNPHCILVAGVASCQLPSGAYCNPALQIQCDSQICTGFPAKCQ